MIRKLLFLLLSMVATVSYADTNYNNVTIGNFKYDLTLSTSGESTAYLNGLSDPNYSGYVYIPGYVDYNGNKYRVNIIRASAFKNNSKITRVYIDYGVTTIQASAFEGCQNLRQVTMPSSINWISQAAFRNCSSLVILAFAGEVPPYVQNYAFVGTPDNLVVYTATYRGANALKNNSTWGGTFGNNIVRNNDYAYDFKKSGIAYVVKNGIPYQRSLSRCIMVGGNPPESGSVTLTQFVDAATMINTPGDYLLEAVADSAFLGNSNVLTVANDVTMARRIGERAFGNCPNLTRAYIAVDSIMINAFRGCSNLTTLKLYKPNESGAGPNGVTYIGNYAFGETGLTSVNIPSSCRKIEFAPFFYANNLKYITVDSDNQYYAAHNGCLYTRDYTHLIQVPCAWNYSETENAFAPSITYINDYAAEGNRTIISLKIPYGVKTIRYHAFSSCSSLAAVRLPSSITELNNYAFRGSTNIEYMYVNLVVPPSLSTYLLPSSIANNIKLYVPHESFTNYKNSANWSSFDLQTGPFDHLKVWDYRDNNDCYWTVLDNTAHNNYAGYSRDGNARLVRGVVTTTIPSAVTIKNKNYDPVEIGRSAFEELDSPISMTVASGSYIKRIKERAFYGTSLSNFTFTRVEEIGDSAFAYTNNLSKALTLDYIKKIGVRAFHESAIKSFTAGSALNSLGAYAFAETYSLASVSINENAPITVIPSYAFFYCTALKSCTLSRNINLIDEYSFHRADLSTKMVFPAALKTINRAAFAYTKLSDIELPYGITTIGEEALTCNATRIVFPATISSIHYKFDQLAHNNLYEFVVNSKTPPTIKNGVSGFDSYSLPRSAGYLYVPVGHVGTYKSKWTQFGGDHRISEGGYDFTDTNDGLKYTITTAVSGNSTGACEMVYNPKVLNTTVSIVAGDAKHDLYSRTYNCTAIGENCFATSTSINSIYITPTLKTIGNSAFLNSSLQSSLESMSGGGSSGYIPTTVTNIGQFAFYGCKKLHELFLPHIDRKNTITLGQEFFGDNASDFKCWVDYRRLPDFVNNSGMWDVNRVYPHLKLDSEWQSFSCIKNIDFNNTLVESYVVSSYNKSQNTAQLNTVLRLPAGTGAVVHGLADGTYYRLGYPSSAPSVSSIMESVTTGSNAVTSNNALSYFVLYYKAPVFNKILTATFHRGYAYLKLNTSLVGSGTTQVLTNLYDPSTDPTGIPGDVNDDGVVSSVDITILYNYLLNGTTEGMVNGDQDGDGIITSVDITIIYNILLGNN